ncbi:unnamed protein product [Phytophthora fragariaefolia]|uniref:Unnamed protein product n=1 Tax=Phytophthora fragariaefolia TaxID=1490495 RepID=A0A9W7D870_9STRA|nr:unnamed protein product [Phytophthora fragariaefolia]
MVHLVLRSQRADNAVDELRLIVALKNIWQTEANVDQEQILVVAERACARTLPQVDAHVVERIFGVNQGKWVEAVLVDVESLTRNAGLAYPLAVSTKAEPVQAPLLHDILQANKPLHTDRRSQPRDRRRGWSRIQPTEGIGKDILHTRAVINVEVVRNDRVNVAKNHDVWAFLLDHEDQGLVIGYKCEMPALQDVMTVSHAVDHLQQFPLNSRVVPLTALESEWKAGQQPEILRRRPLKENGPDGHVGGITGEGERKLVVKGSYLVPDRWGRECQKFLNYHVIGQGANARDQKPETANRRIDEATLIGAKLAVDLVESVLDCTDIFHVLLECVTEDRNVVDEDAATAVNVTESPLNDALDVMRHGCEAK